MNPEPDPLLAWELLTDEERSVRERVRAFCDEHVARGAVERWERAELPLDLVPRLAALGVVGGTIAATAAPASRWRRRASSTWSRRARTAACPSWSGRTAASGMGTMAALGSGEQRARWLPAMTRMEPGRAAFAPPGD